tara:strand:- start:19 stop:468 length:450 start_codon:yes stop_codon:yes gene_type:complete
MSKKRPTHGPSGVGYPSPAELKYEVDVFYDNNGGVARKVYHNGGAITDSFGRHSNQVGYVAPPTVTYPAPPANYNNKPNKPRKAHPGKAGMSSSEQLHLEKQQIAVLSGDKSDVIVQSQYPKNVTPQAQPNSYQIMPPTIYRFPQRFYL